jgi:LacI family transcriptional regulator
MGRPRKGPVTVHTIAQHVGVSAAAVSTVLANRHEERRLAPATVERIREAVRVLGYVPNMAGRRLRVQAPSTRQIDLAILTSFEAPLPLVSQALRALQQAIDAQTSKNTRYAVAIEMFHAGRLRDKPGLLDAHRYHGVILTNTLPDDDAFLAEATLPYPVVVLGRRIPNTWCVLESPGFVGQRAADVLLDAGCRRPAVLHGRLLTQATAERVTAFAQAVEARLGHEPVVLISDGLQPATASAALRAYYAGGGRCDGVFTVTDSLAVGAYHAIQQAGRRIPDDVAVVGVGDYELAEFFTPPLSTVAGGNEAMVAEAVPALFRQLRGEKEAPREIFVVPPVYLRGSTQRVPGEAARAKEPGPKGGRK